MDRGAVLHDTIAMKRQGDQVHICRVPADGSGQLAAQAAPASVLAAAAAQGILAGGAAAAGASAAAAPQLPAPSEALEALEAGGAKLLRVAFKVQAVAEWACPGLSATQVSTWHRC